MRFLLLLLPVLAGVVWLFIAVMERWEERYAEKDLYQRSKIIFDSIQDPILDSVARGRLSALHRIYRRLSRDQNLLGMLICDLDGKIISRSPNTPLELKCDWKNDAVDKMTETAAQIDSGLMPFQTQSFQGPRVHRGIFILLDEAEFKRRGYVLIFHDPSYLFQRSDLAKRYTIYVFLGLGFIISLLTLLVYRWSVSRPVEQWTEVMKGVLTGDTQKITRALETTEFKPLVKDLDGVITRFRDTKQAQPEEETAFWTSIRLGKEYQRLFGESRLCVLADQEPCVHEKRGPAIESKTPANGTVSAVEPIIRACSGVWIGHGSGSADHETADKKGILLVPPDQPEYALKRVWLSREEELGFYYGFSNEGLWPLCHIAHERPVFRHSDWSQYVEVNSKFAEVFTEEIKGTRPIALIQDYHFGLLPDMIRKMRPDALTGLFWHTPWPSPENFRICPWRKELLKGMLGADLIGFQLQYHCNNFLDAVDRFLEARVSRDQFSVTIQGHTCYVKPFPVSVPWQPDQDLSEAEIQSVRDQVIANSALKKDVILGIGVDRLDYTKGIIEKFLAIEKFLEDYPQYIGKLVFLQQASPSRLHIKRYQDLYSEIQKVADRINWKFYQDGYRPILTELSHKPKEEILNLYRASDFCFVNSIHDGMSMVAKEFITSRSDESGVLLLSGFAGAARELKDALIVNPYDIEDCASAIHRAIEMNREEKRLRMSRMRNVLQSNNVYTWGARFFRELHSISERKNGDSTIDPPHS